MIWLKPGMKFHNDSPDVGHGIRNWISRIHRSSGLQMISGDRTYFKILIGLWHHHRNWQLHSRPIGLAAGWWVTTWVWAVMLWHVWLKVTQYSDYDTMTLWWLGSEPKGMLHPATLNEHIPFYTQEILVSTCFYYFIHRLIYFHDQFRDRSSGWDWSVWQVPRNRGHRHLSSWRSSGGGWQIADQNVWFVQRLFHKCSLLICVGLHLSNHSNHLITLHSFHFFSVWPRDCYWALGSLGMERWRFHPPVVEGHGLHLGRHGPEDQSPGTWITWPT